MMVTREGCVLREESALAADASPSGRLGMEARRTECGGVQVDVLYL